MLIVKSDSLPRLWWLFPWSVARQLHKNAVALQALADKQSTTNMVLKAKAVRLNQAVTIQADVIANQSEQITNLRQHIRILNDAIIRGTAITPDAYPHE